MSIDGYGSVARGRSVLAVSHQHRSTITLAVYFHHDTVGSMLTSDS